jgi:peroxiredoxin Q/BCP
MMLKVGEQAPEFSLESDSGTTLSLRDLRGKKLVLYFFPKADTPG